PRDGLQARGLDAGRDFRGVQGRALAHEPVVHAVPELRDRGLLDDPAGRHLPDQEGRGRRDVEGHPAHGQPDQRVEVRRGPEQERGPGPVVGRGVRADVRAVRTREKDWDHEVGGVATRRTCQNRMAMRHWCFITRPNNWTVCREKGVFGFDFGYSVSLNRFMEPLDRGVVYATKKSGFAATVEIRGKARYDPELARSLSWDRF